MIREEIYMENILSVIVPIFNTGNSLKNSLDSLVNQTIKNISIILVDDYSDDKTTKKIIDDYSKKYNNISIVRNKKNLGAGLSRNVGLKDVNSKYVAFLDSDDWIDLDAYQKSIEFLEQNNDIDVAIFDIITEYRNYKSSKPRYIYTNQIIDNEIALKLLSNSHRFNISLSPLIGNRVYRSTLLIDNKINFISGQFEDDYFSFLCLKNARRVALLSGFALHYYQREQSLMHSFSKNNIEGLFTCFNKLKNRLQKENCFDSSKTIYYSYFERCSRSLFNQLFAVESSTIVQKQYLKYYFDLLHENINFEDYIDFIDIERIKEFFI